MDEVENLTLVGDYVRACFNEIYTQSCFTKRFIKTTLVVNIVI